MEGTQSYAVDVEEITHEEGRLAAVPDRTPSGSSGIKR
jgi:hypothetical protein